MKKRKVKKTPTVIRQAERIRTLVEQNDTLLQQKLALAHDLDTAKNVIQQLQRLSEEQRVTVQNLRDQRIYPTLNRVTTLLNYVLDAELAKFQAEQEEAR